MRIPVVLAVALTALCACKGKPANHQEPGSGGAPSTAIPASPTDISMGALKPAGSGLAPDVLLPHGDGSPPLKTTTPISPNKIGELSQLQFPGFLRDVRHAQSYLEVRHKMDSRPRVMASVFVESCANNPCTPMELPKWQALGDALKNYLLPDLRTDPNTDFEVGLTDVKGAPAIYTLQLAQGIQKGSDGNMTGGYSYAYVLYYNDGINQIRVVSEYKDDPMKTKADMVRVLPRADLEAVAKAMVDIYTHEWR